MRTKITGLNSGQVSALRETLTADEQATAVTVTATTATFHLDAAATVGLVRECQERAALIHGRKHHPYASLHAVARKAATTANADPQPQPEPADDDPRATTAPEYDRLVALAAELDLARKAQDQAMTALQDAAAAELRDGATKESVIKRTGLARQTVFNLAPDTNR